MKHLLLILLFLNIIPAPKECEEYNGTFHSNNKILSYSIISSDISNEELNDFDCYLKSIGYNKAKKNPDIYISIGKRFFKGSLPYSANELEGYRLNVQEHRIIIYAATTAGAFYAVQTLQQLKEKNTIKCCNIFDEPAMAHRGLMFDLVRHFRSVDFICKQLDVMASLKMNRLHLHLSDDQAWRVQLDSHPEMIQSSFRKGIEHKGYHADFVKSPLNYVPGTVSYREDCYGGYLSKENIRTILSYAKSRHIEVIPEIDMPGHSTALLEIHPELQCSCEQLTGRVACPGKEATFSFFQDVLDEIMDLFPYKYIHVGGDEASKKNWEICPDCKKRMVEEGLGDVRELQSYMMGRIEKFIHEHGKNMIGWDEIMDGGLCDNAIVMSWRDTKYGYEAISQGHDVIFSPTKYFYLDYYQGHPSVEPMAIGGNVPLHQTWSAPIYAGEHIIGVQGNLWTEYIASDEHFEYMLYPRALAIAEIGWSTKEKRNDFDEFNKRVQIISERIKHSGISVRDTEKDSICLQLNAPVPHLAIGKKLVSNKSMTRLTDGILGSGSVPMTWEKIEGNTTLILDMEEPKDIHYIGTNSLMFRKVFLPEYIEAYVSSNGTDYKYIGRSYTKVFSNPSQRQMLQEKYDPSTDFEYDPKDSNRWTSVSHSFICNENHIRYIKLVVVPFCSYKTMALDEIIVN